MKPSSGVSCAFGAAVVSFSSHDKVVKIGGVVEEPELVKASTEFEAAMAEGNTIGFCQYMADAAARGGDNDEAQVWSFMQVIFGKFRAVCLLCSGARRELDLTGLCIVYVLQRPMPGSSYWDTSVSMQQPSLRPLANTVRI